MIPPAPIPSLVRELKRYDPLLRLHFSEERGTYLVQRKCRGATFDGWATVLWVEDGKGGYVPPDYRILDALHDADLQRGENCPMAADNIEKAEVEEEAVKVNAFNDYCEAVARYYRAGIMREADDEWGSMTSQYGGRGPNGGSKFFGDVMVEGS